MAKINNLERVLVFITLSIFCGNVTRAQSKIKPLVSGYTITGPTSVIAGNSYVYNLSPAKPSNYLFQCVNGSIQEDVQFSTYCTVLWSSASSGTVKLVSNTGVTQASLNVTISPALTGGTITSSPLNQTINYNTAPAILNASLPTGGSCSGLYTYQWQSSPDNTNWTPITSTNTQNYQPPALTASTYFRRNTTCGTGGAVTSNVAQITIYPAVQPGIVNPVTQAINYNTSPPPLTISNLSGGNGIYTYQWQSSTTVNFTSPVNVGTNAATFTPAPATSTFYYRVGISSNGSPVAYSAYATVNVYSQVNPGAVYVPSQTINYGGVPSSLTISGVTGGQGSYLYQWQSSPNSSFSSPTNVGTPSTNPNYAPPALNATTYYRVMVNCNGAQIPSASAVVNVYPQLIVGIVTPSTQTVHYNGLSSLFVSSVSGGNGTYSYQWQSSSDNVNWNNQNDGLTKNYILLGTTPGTTYYRLLVNSNGALGYSNSVTETVLPQLVQGAINPSFADLVSGTTPEIISALPASGGSCGGSYIYQWQSSTDDSHWNNISGATSLSYSPGAVSSTIYYRRMVACTVDTAYTDAAFVLVGAIGANQNFIRTRNITKPNVTDTVASDLLTDPFEVQQNTQYFDGLGRPVQTVARRATPLQMDLVSFNQYDAYGREVNKYLPYVSPSNDGNFKVNEIGEQDNFNSGHFSNEQFFYGTTVFESSPLGRTVASYAPGNSWVGGARGNTVQYQYNSATDSVRIWTIDFPQGSIPVSTAIFASGTLDKTVTQDEAGHMVVEYKDKTGQIVLKKVQLSTSPGNAHVGWLCTYYVYDDLTRLRFVIPPKAIDLLQLNGTWNLSGLTNLTNELCFRYEYDGRTRMVIKKIPGAGEVWMVYDARDRQVMMQDANIRTSGKWMVTVYDSLDRPFMSGLFTDANNQSYHQNLAAASITYPNTSSNYERLTQTYYDDYSWASGAGVISSLNTTYTSNGVLFNTTYNTNPSFARPIVQYPSSHGLVTGSQTEVIENPGQYLTIVSFFDDRGRLIETQDINQTTGKDTVISQYDFSGKLLRNLVLHKNVGTITQSHSVLTKINYDAGGRMLTIYKNIDNAGSDQLISVNRYNELGQLKTKILGNNLDSLAYLYNIRGWLASINKTFISGTTNPNNNWFGMELGYDRSTCANTATSYTGLQYNGNISGILWKSGGDGVGRKYDFTYDNVNRLTGADFNQFTGSIFDKSASIDFSVSNLSYDLNGNILFMNQMGFKVGASGLIDQLGYAYQTNSNKLSQVTDAVNDSASKLGDFHYKGTKGTFDYSYDVNGNLLTDNNKAIDKINYNFLNLPELVHINGKGNIQYTYDAAGNKLKKVTTDSTNRHVTTTRYMSGFVYQQTDTITSPNAGADTLQFIAHEEGRVRWAFHKYTTGYSAYGFEYDFFEKDHLGNTRVVLTQQKDTALYLASMEAVNRSTEMQLFNNIATTSFARNLVSGYPNDLTYSNPNDSVSRLDGNGPRVGPTLLLKVMAGDKLNILAQAFYSGTGIPNPPVNSFTDVLNSLAGGIVSMTAGGKGTIGQLTTNGSDIYNAVTRFLPSDSATTTKPKAYLNWITLDDQLRYVSSYAIPVGSASTLTALSYNGYNISKNGYIYIWVSNETPAWPVYFDNLKVVHTPGPLLEETHYYPFGLTMAGISSKALKAKYTQNNFKYNDKELQNQEFSDGTGLEDYDYGARMYDPQIGRWMVIDEMSSNFSFESPYSYAGNNPISNVDVGGKFKFPIEQLKAIRKNFPTFYKYIMSSKGAEALKNSTTVIGAILKFSKWDKAELQKDFNHGSGAEIRVSDIDIKGQTQNISPYNLTIASKLLSLIEKANGEDKEAALLFTMLTVLHEEAHRGNHKYGTTGEGNTVTGEDGAAVVDELVSNDSELSQAISGLNFTEKGWQQRAINIGRQIIAQQKEKEKKQNAEIDKANLPANITEFMKEVSNAGGTIMVK